MFSNYKFRRGRQEVDELIPDLGVQIDSQEEEDNISFPSYDIDPVTEAPGDILRAVFGYQDSDEKTQAPTTLSSVTTTPGVDAKAETFATTTTTSTQTVTTNSSTAVTLDTRVDPVTTTTTLPSQGQVQIYIVAVNEATFVEQHLNEFWNEIQSFASECSILRSNAISCVNECALSMNPDRGCVTFTVTIAKSAICHYTKSDLKNDLENM